MGADVPSSGWTPLRSPGPSTGRPAGLRGRVGGVRAALPRTDKEEAFFRLALTHALGAAGDAIVTVSLAGTIFFTTNIASARPRVILSLLLTVAPFAVVAPFLGPAIDRSKGGRRLMIVASAGGRAAMCVFMATAVHSLLLYPCALAILILSKAHSVAKSALVPATVDGPSELVRAGSRLAVVASVAGLLAAGPAALVWKAADASWSIRLAAVVYAVGAVMAVRTRPAPPAEMEPADHVDEAARSRGVSLAAICMMTLRGCSGFLTFAVAFVFKRSKAPALWYGVVGTGALLGGFVGNLVGPKLRETFAEERILTLVLAAAAVVGGFAARMDSRLGLALLAFALGLANGIGQLAFDAIVQRDGSEGARGRSFARFEASFQLAWVGAALLPVILPIRWPWVASFTLAVATGAAAIAYTAGRWVLPRIAMPDPPEGWPHPVVPTLAFEAADPGRGAGLVGGGDPGDQAGPSERTRPVAAEPDVWSAVRPDPRATADPWAADTPPFGTPPPGAPGSGLGSPGAGAPSPGSAGTGSPDGWSPGEGSLGAGSPASGEVAPGSPGAPPPGPSDEERRGGGPRRNPGRFGRRP